MQLFFVYIPLYIPFIYHAPHRCSASLLIIYLFRYHNNIVATAISNSTYRKKDDMAGKSAYNTNSSSADNKKHKLFP